MVDLQTTVKVAQSNHEAPGPDVFLLEKTQQTIETWCQGFTMQCREGLEECNWLGPIADSNMTAMAPG